DHMKSTPDAVRKRCDRAIDKLRQMAGRSGVMMSAAALTSHLTERVLTSPSPAGLIARATTAATTTVAGHIAGSSGPIVKGASMMMATAKASTVAASVIAATAILGGAVYFARAQAPRHSAAPPVAQSPPAAYIPPARTQYSPFSGIQWPVQPPQVKVGNEWYELISIDGTPVEQIITFARKIYGNLWQKRFDEDLVEVMTQMGKTPGMMVTLELRTLDSEHKLIKLDGMPMTRANRQAIWKADNPEFATNPTTPKSGP
ncbi:MAG TPA: hypothetical protein VG722_09930, partial [Tepidisphaeraceae bacterium]|nr:hypothetical protein [Tepidisphaeraceae bacterium]